MELKLEHLSKSFREPVLKDISFCFEAGRLYVIKGISGCGKTTLLNILGGIDTEYEGSISRPEKERGAYIFQQSLLLSNLSVRENMLFIRRDAARIEKLAVRLGIVALLDKKPESLSGGERQRAAILRALLSDPVLLLADEPTASLDGENARGVAALIAGLKSPDRILIVATHDPYFDEYADEILELDYGRMMSACRREAPCRPAESSAPQESSHAEKRKRWVDTAFILKRRPELFSVRNLFLGTVFFLLIFLASSFQNNVRGEALRFYAKDKPLELMRIPRDEQDRLTEEDLSHMTIYEAFHAVDGDICAFYLAPKEYSVLMLPDAISAGRFPETEEEILVNTALAQELAGAGQPAGDAVGQALSFCGQRFLVSGVVGSYRGDFRTDYYYAFDYRERPLNPADKHIFMSYNKLKEIGQPHDSLCVMAVWPGLLQDDAACRRLEEAEISVNQYFTDARSLKKRVDHLLPLAYAVLLVLFGASCLYSVSLTRMELFYRRREMGYLQVFGLKKGRIRHLIRLEYLLKTGASLAAACGIWLFLALLYALLFGSFPWPDPGTLPPPVLLLGAADWLSVEIAATSVLRKNTLTHLH